MVVKPRALILGHTGQIGFEVARQLAPTHDIIAPGRAAVDLTRAESLRVAVRESRAAVIINAAGYTDVDQAEDEPYLTRATNAVAPGVLAEEAARTEALLIQYSTDYVFDGLMDRPYAEGDAPAPRNVYGQSKLEGERAVAAAAGRHLVLRTGWVYGPRGRNFLLTMRRLFLEREEVRVVNDQVGTPTSSRQVAAATVKAIASSLEGLYHVAASGLTSWHGFASRILELDRRLDVKCRAVVPITTAEYGAAVRRPAWSVLDSRRFQQDSGMSLESWEEELASIMSGEVPGR